MTPAPRRVSARMTKLGQIYHLAGPVRTLVIPLTQAAVATTAVTTAYSFDPRLYRDSQSESTWRRAPLTTQVPYERTVEYWECLNALSVYRP